MSAGYTEKENSMNKDRWMKNGAILPVVAILMVPALAVAATHVELDATPKTNPTALVVIDNDSQCAGGEIDCIAVPQGSGHNMFFDLDKACKTDGPAYKLSAFRLAEADKAWPTPANPLSKKITDDFNADPTTGYIKWDSNDNTLSDDRIKLKNKNIEAYNVYYEITATECTGTGEIKLDPVIKNGGGGNP
jgi:hypothetical protein